MKLKKSLNQQQQQQFQRNLQIQDHEIKSIEEQENDKEGVIDQQNNNKPRGKNIKEQDDLEDINNNNTNNSFNVQLKNILGIHYDATVYLGQNKQPFKVIVDTGSNMFWVTEKSCTSCNEAGITNRYDCQNSATCENNTELYKEDDLTIFYGHGVVSGKVATEHIYFDKEQKGDGIQIPMLLIDEMVDLNQLSSDGIIGLGREKGSELQITFLDILKAQKVIQNKVFSLYLTGQKCSGNSVLTLGGYDSNIIESEINYINVVKEDMWAIAVPSVSLGYFAGEYPVELKAKTALIDSGTTKITFSTPDIKQIMRTIETTTEVKCFLSANIQGLQDLVCGSDIKNSQNKLLLYANHDKNPQNEVQFQLDFSQMVDQCYLSFSEVKGFVCRLNIQVLDLDNSEHIIILGEVFMQKYVTIFDEENERIGFGVINLAELNKDPNNINSNNFDNDYSIHIVFFQTGLLCVIAVLIVFFSHLYFKYIQQQQIKVADESVNVDASTNSNAAPQGVTIDMSGNGIESFDDSEQHNNNLQETTQENVGGRVKSTDRSDRD